MSLILIAPLPTEAPLTQTGPDGKDTGYLGSDWYQSLFAMQQRVSLSAQVITNPIISLSAQSGSISPTALPVGALSSGVYRIGWYARITQAATTSSSLTVGFAWTEGGLGLTGNGAALVSNLITATQSGSAIVRADPSSPLSYFTTYASVGGVPMLYSLTIMAEFLGS